MKVLTKRLPDGEETYCSARCYNSTRRQCTCICMGLLHGKGETYAKHCAAHAATYLQMVKTESCTYWPATELVQDVQGR